MRRREKVLFLCTHNSARSQMAEGLLRALYGDRYDVYSAGTNPTEVSRYTIRVMSEIGIDISNQRSKSLEEFYGEDFDYVVTLCDDMKENCPFFPGGKVYLHKSFRDPADPNIKEEERLKIFRQIRDEIKN